jgi:hypothetical protein
MSCAVNFNNACIVTHDCNIVTHDYKIGSWTPADGIRIQKISIHLSRARLQRNASLAGCQQSCQIFLGATYQNGIQDGHIIYQMGIEPKYTKWAQNIPTGHKIYEMVQKQTK